MTRSLALEAFDLAPQPPVEHPGPSDDWKSGHAEGLADGLAMAELRQTMLAETVVQAIADLSFTYAEARAQVLMSLRPLFAAIMSRLLPDIATAALLPHVVDLLAEAAQADSAMPVAITVHPSLQGGLAQVLASAGTPMPKIQPDPNLGLGQVILRHGGSETALDLDGLVTDITAVLASILDTSATEAMHG